MSNRTSLTQVTKRDLKKFATATSRFINEQLNEEARKTMSLSICLDAICTVLDKRATPTDFKLDGSPKLFSDYLKEELDARKEKMKPPVAVAEEKKEPDANPTSDK